MNFILILFRNVWEPAFFFFLMPFQKSSSEKRPREVSFHSGKEATNSWSTHWITLWKADPFWGGGMLLVTPKFNIFFRLQIKTQPWVYAHAILKIKSKACWLVLREIRWFIASRINCAKKIKDQGFRWNSRGKITGLRCAQVRICQGEMGAVGEKTEVDRRWMKSELARRREVFENADV